VVCIAINIGRVREVHVSSNIGRDSGAHIGTKKGSRKPVIWRGAYGASNKSRAEGHI
jgi:hypothetical protein